MPATRFHLPRMSTDICVLTWIVVLVPLTVVLRALLARGAGSQRAAP
jgi:hypothetical protein